ncbi:MAG: hypothetical protein ACRYGC_03675, partial [Janthinobacterium lividum]
MAEAAPEFSLRLEGRRVLVADAGDAAPALARLALRAGAHVTLHDAGLHPGDAHARLAQGEGAPSFDGVLLCLTASPALAARARAAGVLCGVPGHPALS